MTENTEMLEEALSYHFKDVSLLKHALIHPSWSNENALPKEASNQRLEFLGDAVLEMISSIFLFHREPVIQEGVMTKIRAALVCENALAQAARRLKLAEYIYLGRGEEKEGINLRDSVLSDTLEAVIGAIYLDGGFEPAKAFIYEQILSDIENSSLYRDAKTELQKYVSRERIRLEYRILEESGPCHERFYRMGAYLDDNCFGEGTGSSKKKAEQHAAYNSLLRIKAETGYVFKIY